MQSDPMTDSDMPNADHPDSVPVVLLRFFSPLAVLALGVAGFVVLGGKRQAPARQAERVVPLVEAISVEPHEGGLDIEASGLVVPYREVTLSAEVAGRVVYKSDELNGGHFVRQGTELLRIDRRDYDLEIQRLSRELDQAKVTLAELDVEQANNNALIELSREEVTLQAREVERIRSLVTSKVYTDSDVDQARRNELTALNNLQKQVNQTALLNTRRNRLLRAQELVEAQLERAQLDLERTVVNAPFDGVVVEDLVEQDAYLTKGTQIAKLEDTSKVEVQCSLRMEELQWLWSQFDSKISAAAMDGPAADYQLPHTPVSVVYQLSGERFVWDGVLSRYDGIGMDEKTRTVPCRVVVEEPRAVRMANAPTQRAVQGPRALVRGMYVTVRIHCLPRSPLLKIPERAIRPGNKVWRVADGKLEVLTVHVAHQVDEQVLVDIADGDLSAGDRIVVSPLAVAIDGMSVEDAPARPSQH